MWLPPVCRPAPCISSRNWRSQFQAAGSLSMGRRVAQDILPERKQVVALSATYSPRPAAGAQVKSC